MGKKRVIQKGATSEGERAPKAAPSSGHAKKIESGRIYINASYNNTLIAITDERGNLVRQSSAGSLGFRGPKKATPYAATKVVESLSDQIHRIGLKRAAVYVKGIGSGRESALRALPSQGIEIIAIKDVTPIPHNGPRPRKPRRV